MRIKVYSLSYCDKCLKLKQGLKDSNIDFEDLDADKYYDESIQLEELLNTKSYPILVIEDRETTCFINESRGPQKVKEGLYTLQYSTIDSLLLQVKNLIN